MLFVKLESQSLALQSTSGTPASTKNPKLERSAHEFEASLMAELLKPLQEGNGLTAEGSDSGAGSEGALSDFASQSLARAISERGGFGIANRILHQLESGRAGAEKKPQGNPLPESLKLSGSRPI